MKVRLTSRRLMAAVLVVALGFGAALWCQRRADRFRRLSLHHAWAAAAIDGQAYQVRTPWAEGQFPEEARLRRLGNHHQALAHKYRIASERPWLPVGADPPEPE